MDTGFGSLIAELCISINEKGISGLKALRVTVNTESEETGKKIDTEKLLKVAGRLN